MQNNKEKDIFPVSMLCPIFVRTEMGKGETDSVFNLHEHKGFTQSQRN